MHSIESLGVASIWSTTPISLSFDRSLSNISSSRFILRVQTDGTLTPRAAVIQACRELVHDFALLNQEFTKEWELRKMVGADNNATAAAGTGTGTGNGAGAGTDGPANPGGAVNGGTE